MRLLSKIRPTLAQGLAATLLLTGGATLTLAQNEPTQDYAILIVGDEADAEILRKEKVLIQEMAKNLKKQPRLPIFSYHFSREKERSYCERKLNIQREDLLFVGLVSVKDKVPRKVVYRIDRIVTPSRAAADIITRAEETIPSEVASPTASPSQTPEPGPSASPTPAPSSQGRFRVQLGVFTQQKFAQDLVDQLKAKGYDAKFDKSTDEGKETYKVWVGTFQTKEDAHQASTELQADGFEKGFVVEAK